MKYNAQIEHLRAALNGPREFISQDETRLIDDPKKLIKAAVLIAITDQEQPSVILTQRPKWLRSHAGQVAFPGGKMDDSDNDICHTALREAHEELSIDPNLVDIISTCPEYCTGSGYRITPIVGVISPDIAIKSNPDEVESWFETPMEFLLNPANMYKKATIWNGQNRSYYDMQWNEYRIWGVTAGIIANLSRRIKDYNHAR